MIGRFLRRLARPLVLLIGVILTLGASPPGAADTAPAGPPPGPVTRGLKRWWMTAAAIALILALGGAVLVVSGVVPVRASNRHWAITAWFLDFAKKRSVATYSLGSSPPPLDDPLLILKGGTHYDLGCRPCHGGPDIAAPRIAAQMTPPPPYLPTSVGQYDAGQLFQIVKHGIKFTGMPAWPALQRDEEVWAVVAFLNRFPELDANDYRRLVEGDSPAGGGTVPLVDLGPPAPRAVVDTCQRCHGLRGEGRGVGAFPQLAGQRIAYLEATLEAYARGERHSGIMEPIALGLDPAETREIAEYYASLPSPVVPARNVDGAAIARGEIIATRGLPDRRVPACLKCHGTGEPPRNPHYPRLGGQYAEYLMLQLTLFREDRRGGTAYHRIMREVASQLTEDQIDDVAAYFASRTPAD